MAVVAGPELLPPGLPFRTVGHIECYGLTKSLHYMLQVVGGLDIADGCAVWAGLGGTSLMSVSGMFQSKLESAHRGDADIGCSQS